MKAEERHPCRVCATWRCSTCGWKRSRAAKLRPEKQFCARCGSTVGEFLDVRHTAGYVQAEHDQDALDMECTYCHQLDPSVRQQVNPYEHDINGDATEVWLHDACAAELALEI